MKNITKKNIAIIGFGIVGGGTYDILTANRKMIADNQGVDITVSKVLDLDATKLRAKGVPEAAIAKGIDEIVSDPNIDVVVETIGGVEPAKSMILASLKAGKSVVTANKELISKHFVELRNAESDCARLYFEASCAGGVPVIRTLGSAMQANNIVEVMGIINGTTNFILDKMSTEGLGYAEALKIAQDLGYAEANPAADVEGYDAMYKLSILSSLAFRTHIPYTGISREGIDKITPRDIAIGKVMGYTVKLLGIARKSGSKIEARVHPCFVPNTHPLSGIGGSYNAVYLKGDFVDDIMLYGRGAGAHPTGSAIVSDIVMALIGNCVPMIAYDGKAVSVESNYVSKYYFSIAAADKAGVLAKVTAVLAKFGVSIVSMTQSKPTDGQAYISFLTHDTYEQSMSKAIAEIAKITEVTNVDSMIRVI